MRRSEVSTFTQLWARVSDILERTDVSTLQLTGILGVLTVVILLYARTGKAKSVQQSSTASHQPAADHRRPQKQESSQLQPDDSSQDLAWRVRKRLANIKTVTISCPGVLLRQDSPRALEKGAEPIPGIREIVLEIVQNANVYLITQVESDEAEAGCRSVFEGEELLGTTLGQIASHRCLFCSTREGKASIVRQIDPQLHFEHDPATIEALKRFVRLVHVTREAGKIAANPNVETASSFQAYFGS